ncbi:MAG: hypothetical protein IKC82_03555 [Lentisphaeria bacterium]|nr:hypothetical protein [Lentisphaeria bacterium]
MSEYDEINVDDIRLVSRTPKKTVAKPAAPAVPAPAVPAPEKEQDVDTVSLATRRRAEVGDKTVSFKEPPTRMAFAVDPDKKVESGNVPKIATIKKTAIANGVQDIFGISKKGSRDNPGTAAKPEAPVADKAVPELKKPVAHINPQAVAIPPSPALVMPPKAAESGKKDKKSKNAAPPAAPGGSSSRLQAPPPSVSAAKMPDIKPRNYASGCLLFVVIVAILGGGGYYLCSQNWETVREYLGRFEQWMIDHNLAFDGGDAPWKHKKQNEPEKVEPKKDEPAKLESKKVEPGKSVSTKPAVKKAAPKRMVKKRVNTAPASGKAASSAGSANSGSTVYGKAIRHASNTADKQSNRNYEAEADPGAAK